MNRYHDMRDCPKRQSHQKVNKIQSMHNIRGSITLNIDTPKKSQNDLRVKDKNDDSSTMVSEIRNHLNQTVLEDEWKKPHEVKVYEELILQLASHINMLKLQNAKLRKENEDNIYDLKVENNFLRTENERLHQQLKKYQALECENTDQNSNPNNAGYLSWRTPQENQVYIKRFY